MVDSALPGIALRDTLYCKSCDREQPKSNFGADKARANGIDFYCRACRVTMAQRLQETRRARKWKDIDPPEQKPCARCGEVKPRADFNRSKFQKDGLYTRCRACVNPPKLVYTRGRRKIDPVVYVLWERGSDFYKVGYTDGLEARFAGIQTGNPRELEIVAAYRGGRELETAIHDELEPYWIRGEWFECQREALLAIVKRVLESRKA